MVHYMCSNLVKSSAPLKVLREQRHKVAENHCKPGEEYFINQQTTKCKDTPAHLAVKNMSYSYETFFEILKQLLKFEEIDLTIVNTANITPLESLLYQNKYLEDPIFDFSNQHTRDVLEQLMSRVERGSVSSVVAYGINHYSHKTCKILLAKFQPTSELQWTEKEEEILQESFRETFDKSGETALHSAVRLNSKQKLQLLSEADKTRTWFNFTPEELGEKIQQKTNGCYERPVEFIFVTKYEAEIPVSLFHRKL